MRFGLHLADVLVENDDLIGDGVNLAARIQQAAEPDAIDVSGALFEQIRRNSPFAFDERGEQSFRNISEPVRVYRVRGEIDRHVYQNAPTQPAPKLAKRPQSLAVMPIEAGSGDEDRRYLAEGVTEELIFELGRFKKLFVTSRSATRALFRRSRSAGRRRPPGGEICARRHAPPGRQADSPEPLALGNRDRRRGVERPSRRKHRRSGRPARRAGRRASPRPCWAASRKATSPPREGSSRSR